METKSMETNTAMIRAVKVLPEELRKRAIAYGFSENDIVFVKTTHELERIDGSIIEYLRNNGIVIKE